MVAILTKRRQGFTPLETMEQKNERKRQRRFLSLTGFTLIEILVVVTIALIIVGITFFSNRDTWLYIARVDGATRRLAVDLKRTQQLAIGKRTNYYLQFLEDLGINDTQYGYQIYEGGVVGSGTALATAPETFDKNVVINEDLTNNDYIMFGTLGQVSASNLRVGVSAPNPYYVQLESLDGNEVRYVCISSQTGYVDITQTVP